MIRCANCFTPLPDAASRWRCGNAGCRVHVAVGAAGDRPDGDLTQPETGRAPVVAPSCGTCGTACSEVCPTCRYRLPTGWRGSRVTCIVMAGARATGKSIFIAVMVKQLEQLGRRGLTVVPADTATAATFAQHYEGPLYKRRDTMKPTSTAISDDSYQREPLVFSLHTPHGEQFFLAIRDVAGEDLESTRPFDAAQLGFFSRADGVVFLFDPLAVPAVRMRLADLVLPMISDADPRLVLERTLGLLRGSSTRLAVVLSKFDAMQSLADVEDSEWGRVMQNRGAAFLRDPGPLALYDEDDGQLLHEEVRSLLQRLGAGALVGRVEAARATSGIEYRFFAVSALGEAPTGQALHKRGIAPFRCLDPVKWLMGRVA